MRLRNFLGFAMCNCFSVCHNQFESLKLNLNLLKGSAPVEMTEKTINCKNCKRAITENDRSYDCKAYECNLHMTGFTGLTPFAVDGILDVGKYWSYTAKVACLATKETT